MKKTLAILLTLALLCGMSALAELGSADVAMNGNQYHISLESVEIKDGKLYVALNGMAQTMAFGPEGRARILSFLAIRRNPWLRSRPLQQEDHRKCRWIR